MADEVAQSQQNQNTSNKANLGDIASKQVAQQRAAERAAEKQQKAADLKWRKDREKELKELGLAQEKINKTLDAESLERKKENAKKLQDIERKNLESNAKYAERAGERFKAGMKLAAQNAASFAKNMADSMYSAAQKSVAEYAGLLSQYQSAVSARVQGSGKTFQDMYEMIRKNIGSSQYVSQAKVLENLSSLVSKGIEYNVEQRAFLQTIKDDIATTFDVANGTLLRLIKIQQSDSTVARLGMEAALTRFLNGLFQDTSYLSDAFDVTSASLIDFSSSYSRRQSVELEFIIQKWLGALGSVGVSDETLSTLASGINALGTGGVSALSGNTALQSLLVMASGRAGVGYGELLTGGFTAERLEGILRGIVEYAQTLSESDNRVLLSSYAQIFGMSVSDLYALRNLDIKTLNTISQTNLTYSNMLAEVDYQIKQLPSRLHISERIDNMLDNTLATIGGGIANNAFLYTTYLLNDLVEAATGGINLPFINTFFGGIDLNANLNQLIKVVMLGGQLMSSLGSVVGGLMGKTPSLSEWGAQDITKRGFDVVLARGLTRKESESLFVGNADYSDIYSQTVSSAKEEAAQESGDDTSQEETKEMPKNVSTLKETLVSIAATNGPLVLTTELLRKIVEMMSGFYSTSSTKAGAVPSSNENGFVAMEEENKGNTLSDIYNLLYSVISAGKLQVSSNTEDPRLTTAYVL